MRKQEPLCSFMRRIAAGLWPAGESIAGNRAAVKSAAAVERYAGSSLCLNKSLHGVADTAAAAPAIGRLFQSEPSRISRHFISSSSNLTAFCVPHGTSALSGARALHTSHPAGRNKSSSKKPSSKALRTGPKPNAEPVQAAEDEVQQPVPRLVETSSKSVPNLDIESLGVGRFSSMGTYTVCLHNACAL